MIFQKRLSQQWQLMRRKEECEDEKSSTHPGSAEEFHELQVSPVIPPGLSRLQVQTVPSTVVIKFQELLCPVRMCTTVHRTCAQSPREVLTRALWTRLLSCSHYLSSIVLSPFSCPGPFFWELQNRSHVAAPQSVVALVRYHHLCQVSWYFCLVCQVTSTCLAPA